MTADKPCFNILMSRNDIVRLIILLEGQVALHWYNYKKNPNWAMFWAAGAYARGSAPLPGGKMMLALDGIFLGLKRVPY